MKSVFAAVLFTVLANALAAQSIDLTFAWPVGLRLRADCEFRRENTLPTGKSVLTSRYSFVWSLREHPKGFALDFTDYRLIRSEPVRSLDPLVRLDWTVQRVSALLPTLVVDSGAQPVALERLDELKRTLEQEFSELEMASDPQAARLLEILMAEQQIEARALEDWNRMVQIWAGATELTIGETFAGEATTGTGTGVPVSNEILYSVEAGSAPGLVVLRVLQRPRPDQVRPNLTAILGSDPFEALHLPPEAELVVENSFAAETDPKTLIPVSFWKEKTWGARSGADKVFVGRRNIWSYRFSPLHATDDSTTARERSSNRTLGPEETAQVLADVRRLATAMQESDRDTILDLTHPRVIEIGGGREKFHSLLKTTMAGLAKSKATVESFSVTGEPEFFADEAGREYVIVRTRMLMTVEDKRLESRAFMLGVRSIPSGKWTYLNGEQLHGSMMQQLFPEFPTDRALPRTERKLVQ